jgi:glycerol kinase
MQSVSNILGHALIQSDAPEASALGAAYLAGLSLGVWPDLAAIATLPRSYAILSPVASDAADRLLVWRDAICRSTLPAPSSKGE